MADSVDIISKVFLGKNELTEKIEAYASINNLTTYHESDYNISLVAANAGTLYVYFMTQEKFNYLKELGHWGQDYAILFYIEVYSGDDEDKDKMAVPFLRELLKDYPDLLIFNEEVQGGKPYVYSKAHLDAFTGKYFDDIFLKPPRI